MVFYFYKILVKYFIIMGKIYFLIGGARSGKSQYSERLAASISGRVGYLATAEIIDEEMEKRVSFHRKRRPDSWETFEIQNDRMTAGEIREIVRSAVSLNLDVLLIDCITILLFRILYRFDLDELEVISNELEAEIEKEADDFFTEFLAIIKTAVSENGLNVIIVSNEVGLGLVPPYPFGRIFRDILGNTNRRLAELSDEVYFFIAGLNLKMK